MSQDKKDIKPSTVEKMSERITKNSGGKISSEQARKIAIATANKINSERRG
jgi:hypothetical protein